MYKQIAPYHNNGKYGFKLVTGGYYDKEKDLQILTDAIYDECENGNRYMLEDDDNALLISWYKLGDKYGAINFNKKDKDGNYIDSGAIYDGIDTVQGAENYIGIPVKIGKLWGIVNDEFKIILPPNYIKIYLCISSAHAINKNHYIVVCQKVNGKRLYGIFDLLNKSMLFEPQFKKITDNQWHVYGRKQTIAIDIDDNQVLLNEDGSTKIITNGGNGFQIEKTIPLATGFIKAKVKKPLCWGLMKDSEKWIFPPIYNYIGYYPQHQKYFCVTTIYYKKYYMDDKQQCLDREHFIIDIENL